MDVLIAAASGAIAAVIGSLIEPWVQWAVERRRDRQKYRRELIQSWRELISEQVGKTIQLPEIEDISHTSEYSMMKQHLSDASREWIETPWSKRIDYVKQVGPSAWRKEKMEYRRRLLDEIARLEQDWGLV